MTIQYNAGYLGVNPGFIFHPTGSVLGRALLWAIPNAVLGAALWFFWATYYPEPDSKRGSVSSISTGYATILGFMVVFRMQLAYNRFWEAAIRTHEMRAVWFSCCSSLFAFTSFSPDKKDDVFYFQQVCVRLFSMLHEAACERLDARVGQEYLMIDNDGMDKDKLAFLERSSDRVEVIEQWIERLIVQNANNGVLTIPPPVLGGCFKDLSSGISILADLEVVADFPLPFPYAQTLQHLLLFQFCVTPVVASLVMYNYRWAAGMAFTSTICLWAINYIAMEIERPFADHPNNLDGPDLQVEMNRALEHLLDDYMQEPPQFTWNGEAMNFIKVQCETKEHHVKQERQIAQHGKVKQKEAQ